MRLKNCIAFRRFSPKPLLFADVARAREELDGLRRPTRPFNPLTIIQVKPYFSLLNPNIRLLLG